MTLAEQMREEGIVQVSLIGENEFTVVCKGYNHRGYGATLREAVDDCKSRPAYGENNDNE